MKAKITIIIFILLFGISFSQNEASQKLNECKQITIKLFQSNSTQDELSKCLVSLAFYGEDITQSYTNWANEIANETQDQLQSQLSELEVESQQAAQARQQSFNNMVNGISENIQNQTQAKQNTNNNSQGSSSGCNQADGCVGDGRWR